MSVSKGKRQRLDASESEYSDNFDEEESDTGSASSYNEKISSINSRKRLGRNSSELNKQFQHEIYNKMADQLTTGKRKRCYSKNALNARENRIKKKIYLENLEKTVEKYKIKNKQLSLLLENQNNLMSDMKKEVQYFKSILANSKDISRLLKGLNQSTGMPVTTSINKNMHPWTETSFSSLNKEFVDNSEYNLPLDTFLPEPALSFDDSLKLSDDVFQFTAEDVNDEHNYNANCEESLDIQDVGICLHISNHKMSLEFCPTCSEQATSTWRV